MLAPPPAVVYYSSTTTVSEAGPVDALGVVLCGSTGRMEHRLQKQADKFRQRLQTRQSSPALQQNGSPRNSRPQPTSSPLPQTPWTDISPPYQPRSWAQPDSNLYPARQHQTAYVSSSAPWMQDSLDAPNDSRTSPTSPSARRRRRSRGVRDLLSRGWESPPEQLMDVTMLYPHISHYGTRLSTYSAPDELEYSNARSISQPRMSSYMPLTYPEDAPSSMGIPRSPTYPPAGRRRMHSATGVGDAAFEDEEEFRLFVEATAGLGPDQAFRHWQSESPSRSSPRRRGSERPPLNRPVTTGDIVSPLGETPTTMYALQQLAQMPEGSHELGRQRLHTSMSGLDLWSGPPDPTTAPGSTTVSAPGRVPNIEPIENFEDFEDLDDELPDYAESQAQAQAHQRAEAARRAQELQQRWQQSGARRGH